MRNKILFFAFLSLTINSCKSRSAKNSASSEVKGAGLITNNNQPALAANKETCSVGIPRDCFVTFFFHPWSSAKGQSSKNEIDYAYSWVNSLSRPKTCGPLECRDLARVYLNRKTVEVKIGVGEVQSDTLAAQWEYNNGILDDSDGLLCRGNLTEDEKINIEGQAGAYCGKGENN